VNPTKIIRPVGYQVEYSYAGFEYRLIKVSEKCWTAEPLPGQHPSAARARHCSAALQCYTSDYNEE
jgi:hypothetical protein